MRLTGTLLVAGWVLFWIGAFTPPYRWWYGIPVAEYLELINANRAVWRFIAVIFALGVLATLAGVTSLGSLLRAAGDTRWSDLAVTSFIMGSVLWLTSIAFRITATVTAAEQMAIAGGTVPPWFEGLRGWSGAIFAVYMVVAYLGIAALGMAMRQTTLLPRWLATLHVWFGAAGAIGYIVRIPLFDPPLMIPLVPGIAGIVLLRLSTG